ncbi:histidinol-phosphate transaminase [Nocardia colli]|uniref:Histidinol-phosphate aminotransferase n=1 Tax=Nocardia colli TaxID=2545717 RepID=A0A5N0DVB1_9NOCA|nr:histidinol-phosphate transaminase [Nocardia colli]KAA8880586.1 histidinol-phosphate transaminase [Nocardia colli]
MDEIMHLVRPAIAKMTPYSSARTEGSQIAMRIRLDANESPYPPYPAGADQYELNRYPEGQPEQLLDTFADFYGVPRDRLLFTRGADEAIDLLVRGFCTEGIDAILQASPTFAMYAHSAQVQGVDIVDVPLVSPDFQLDVAGILAARDEHPNIKLLFFCSPNNPTGNLLERNDILSIATALTGKSIIVVDELYLDYSGTDSLAAVLSDCPNIVVLRSMSKEYSLAGERFGITIANPEIISVLGRMLAPYSLTQTAIRAVAQAMTPDGLAYARANIANILDERWRVSQALAASPVVVKVFLSDANFLLVEVDDARRLVRVMQENGIKIRDRSTMHGTGNCVRISIGTPAENDAMLSVLECYSEEWG